MEPMSSSENSLVGDEADEDMMMKRVVATVDAVTVGQSVASAIVDEMAVVKMDGDGKSFERRRGVLRCLSWCCRAQLRGGEVTGATDVVWLRSHSGCAGGGQ